MANVFKKKDLAQIFLKKAILSVPFLILLLIIFIIFSISTARVYLQGRKIHKSRLIKEEQVNNEEKKKEELNKKLSEIQSSEGLEKNLREKFQIKKPGEEVVVLVNPKSGNNENEKPKNFVRRFFNWIFKK